MDEKVNMMNKTDESAFTLVEVMIALVVVALLLGALGAAVHATLYNYRQNEQIATVMQTGRSILDRMSREVRTAQAVDYADGNLTIIPPDDGSGITEIQYQQVGSELIYRLTKDGTQSSHTLIAGTDEVALSNFVITQQIGKDWQGFDCVKAITLELGLTIGGKQYGMTATARPRRNQIF